MPAKKNAAKTEKTTDNPKEPAARKEKPKKNVASVVFSPRVLRPRKTPPVSPSPAPKKTKQASKTTRDVSPNINGAAATKKQGNPKGRKAKLEKTSEEEPPAKLGKVEAEEEDRESNHNDDDQVNPSSSSSIYEFKANTIQGEEISLSKYKGHVCLIVNVASKCGHTASNYKELVELFDKYGESKGLKILAFPCNQFGKQEPGDNEKICEFAKKKNVKFDMFEKVNVNGKNAHPLWAYLTSQKQGPKGAKIDWNFTKFLINKDGQVVDRFKSAIKPLTLVSELEKLW